VPIGASAEAPDGAASNARIQRPSVPACARCWSVAIAAERDSGRVADLVECVAAQGSESLGEPLLRDGVEAVAVDHGGPVYACVGVDRDLDGQATSLGGDLGHGHVGTDIEHLVA